MALAEPTPGKSLRRALQLRHLVMLSVGGTIASGFLLFVGSAIAIAGPATLISFALAGLIAVAVMACLAELSVTRPVTGSFAIYARDTMGPMVGFLTGWNYWLAWVMAVATESVAAGTYLHSFYNSIPVWAVAFLIIAVEMIINAVGVLFMGEFAFVLSTIKIIALVAFVILGICAILGIGFAGHGLSEYTAHGGFFPKGGGSALTALLTVFFAYAGIELLGVTAEESIDPASVPRALFYTVGIVVGLFLLGIFVLLALLPWTAASTSSSPLVDAIKSLHIPLASSVFNWIVISASVSSVDGGIYTASRMLFAMAREGHFSQRFAVTHLRRHTPTLAIVVTASCTFVGSLLAYLFPNSAYVFIASLSTFGFLCAWLMIAIAQPLYRLKMGRAYVRKLTFRTPLYPLTPIIAVVAVVGALVGQFFTGGPGTKIGPLKIPGGGLAIVVGVIWTALWCVYYLVYARRTFSHGQDWHREEAKLARLHGWAVADGPLPQGNEPSDPPERHDDQRPAN